MREEGKIATWKDEKGYGFIRPMDGGSELFVHIKAFDDRGRRPEVGDVVTYTAAKDNRGRLRAEQATLAGAKRRMTRRVGRNGTSLFGPSLFLVAIGVSALLTGLPLGVPVVYLAMSIVTFVVYAVDKSAAQKGRWRTSEGTLHLLALFGGWPGALVAQKTLRHKSRKASFRVVFWATVLLNCVALAWLHTVEGQDQFNQLLSAEHGDRIPSLLRGAVLRL